MLTTLLALGVLVPSLPGAVKADPIEMTLDEAVQRALSQNAEMAIRVAELAAAQAEAKAAARPAPLTLSLSPASIWEQFEATISSILDISGRRKWASRAARHEVAATVAGNEEFALELAANVRSSYWRLKIAQERLVLAEEQVSLAEAILRSTERLVAAGVAMGIDRDRAANELAGARVDASGARARIREAQIELGGLLYLPVETPIAAADPLPAAGENPMSGADLQEVALASRPAMRKVGALAKAALAHAGIASAEGYPDLEVSLEREEGVNFGRALLELPLIDFGTIKHGKRAAKARTEAALAAVDVVEAEIRQEVQSAANGLVATREIEKRLNDELIPCQQDLVARLRRGYEARSVNYLDLLEAQAALQDLRCQWIDAVLERVDSHVRLERALGKPLEETSDADRDD